MKTTARSEDFGFRDLPRAIWFFLAEERWKALFFLGVLILVLFYNMVPPFIIGQVADFLVRYQAGERLPLSQLYVWVGVLAGSFVLVSVIRLSSKRMLGKISLNARYRAKVWGFERLLDFSLAWHQTESTGNKAQRVLTGCEAIREWTGDLMNNIFPALVAFIGAMIACMYLHPAFGLFFVYYLGGLLGIEAWFDHRISKISDRINKSIENASGTFVESASNILAVKAMGAAGGMTSTVMQREEMARTLAYERLRMTNTKWMCFQVHNGIAWGSYILVIAWMVLNDMLGVGFVLTYAAYYTMLRESATQFTDQIQTMIERKSNLGRMMPIFWSDNRLQTGEAAFPAQWDAIVARDASFRYAGEAAGSVGPFDFSIARGEKIGVAGHSGSGKSTLIKLMLGLYHLEKGELKIGDTPIRDIRHEALTAQVAVVLQETELFNFSLKENLTMMRNVDPALVDKAIRIACLEELIERLPQGLETVVGEKGYSLSGGERQRVGIARAICRDAPILLMDEATSALDSTTEQRVMDGLMGEYAQGRTMIIVAHRISTLKEVDRVFVFDHGRIVEEDSFDALAGNPDTRFGAMYAIQAA